MDSEVTLKAVAAYLEWLDAMPSGLMEDHTIEAILEASYSTIDGIVAGDAEVRVVMEAVQAEDEADPDGNPDACDVLDPPFWARVKERVEARAKSVLTKTT